jgi:tRNA dimethylallyltransferase
MRSPALFVIAGPTASGKTAAAVALAERLGAEIVSCDSVAVYREVDVGAAKPTLEERARVPHHLVDVAAPDEGFTAARYVELADAAIADCARRRRPVIVAGGTGLYLRALVHGLFASPPPDPSLRERIKAEAAAHGWPLLHARLAAIDPDAAARIAPVDPVRIERALEVYEQTGVPISRLQAEHARAAADRYPSRIYVIDPPAPVLEERIAARTDRMLAAGLVEETRRLAARWGREVKPLGALGYKEALAFLDGGLGAAELREAIRLATRRFAKRQRTWFRKEPAATWIADAGALPVDEIARFVDA